MRCTKCGHKLRIGDEFCSKCGHAVEPDIVYDDRDDYSDRGFTKKYQPYGNRENDYRDEDIRYEQKKQAYEQKQRDYEQRQRNYEQSYEGYEHEHDITGEINLDYEDSRARKASNWTSKLIIAAVGIAAAFVIAIIALNVQNMFKQNEDADAREALQTEEETTRRSYQTTEATTQTTEAEDSYSYDDSESYGAYGNESNTPGVKEFFEDIGGKIRDTAGEYGERIDDSISSFGERLREWRP